MCSRELYNLPANLNFSRAACINAGGELASIYSSAVDRKALMAGVLSNLVFPPYQPPVQIWMGLGQQPVLSPSHRWMAATSCTYHTYVANHMQQVLALH